MKYAVVFRPNTDQASSAKLERDMTFVAKLDSRYGEEKLKAQALTIISETRKDHPEWTHYQIREGTHRASRRITDVLELPLSQS